MGKVVGTSNNKRKRDDDPLIDPEEEEKRRMRRDRNRLAAAKCRKRRLDQIETLQVEVEGWERRNKKLEDEIAALRAEKDEMAFILEAHRSSCKLQGDVVSEVMVKVEPPTMEANQETEYVQVQVVEPTPLVTSIHKPQRPVSLSLKPAAGGHIEGVPIETPSNLHLDPNQDNLQPQHSNLWISTQVQSDLHPTVQSKHRGNPLDLTVNKRTFIQSMYINLYCEST